LTKDELDVADSTQIERCLREFRPRAMINAAAYTAVGLAEN
jgi:dTDP-4-dehydrorhamnose reductase